MANTGRPPPQASPERKEASMLPGETLANGCPVLCPDCQVEVLPPRVLPGSAGYYIGTRCNCGPAYTRESDYYPTEALAEAALADRWFGRGGIVARNVAVYWTDRVDPHPFRITVLHRSQPGRLHEAIAPGPLVRVFQLAVVARTPQAACGIAHAVTNSEPNRLVCDPSYAEQVAAYRAAGLRSLAIGDVLVARDEAGTQTTWVCRPATFARLQAIPPYRTGC
jgi:hypothetical protein